MNKYGDNLTKKAYSYAKKYDLKITDGTMGWNDEGDAFRHAYMQADLVVKSTPGLSKSAGDIHEIQGDIQHRQDPKEKNMDLWNNNVGREVGEEIKKEYSLRSRIEMVKNGQMDDVIAEKVAQRVQKGDLITQPNDTRKYVEPKTPSQKFDDEIRAKYNSMKNRGLQKVFDKSKSNNSSGSGGGRWVTINSAHIYMEN